MLGFSPKFEPYLKKSDANQTSCAAILLVPILKLIFSIGVAEKNFEVIGISRPEHSGLRQKAD